MLISLIAAMIAAPAVVYPAVPIAARDAKCPERPSVFDAAAASIPKARRLDREPPASLYLTVYREVDGCATPVVLRKDVGR